MLRGTLSSWVKAGGVALADRGARKTPGISVENNRTKTFHVKHFGTIEAMNLTSPHSSRDVKWCDRAVSKSCATMVRASCAMMVARAITVSGAGTVWDKDR